MNGFRFYEEFKHKRRRESAGTVVALIPENRNPDGTREAIVGLFEASNSSVCGGSASDEYLRAKCRRISEARAREIHPALFARLDADEASA